MSFQIGPYLFKGYSALAPMAGVTDRPFRQLCRTLGANMTVSEMITSKQQLLHTRKTQLRMNHLGEPEPIIVQIAGTEPDIMAQAAQFQVQNGAHIIDINMGCPAKKVCKVDAGSALMKNETKVAQILKRVVRSVEVPVTLKTRLGWNQQHKNIITIAKIAEDSGIAALTIHGRTRDQKYNGMAEYQLIKKVKSQLNIPVIANGDIDTPKKAQRVMDFTNCDAIMLGRVAQQRPWVFNSINAYLEQGKILPQPSLLEQQQWLLKHLQNLYAFYGDEQGVRIARKHIKWQRDNDPLFKFFHKSLMGLTKRKEQYQAVQHYFTRLINTQSE